MFEGNKLLEMEFCRESGQYRVLDRDCDYIGFVHKNESTSRWTFNKEEVSSEELRELADNIDRLNKNEVLNN